MHNSNRGRAKTVRCECEEGWRKMLPDGRWGEFVRESFFCLPSFRRKALLLLSCSSPCSYSYSYSHSYSYRPTSYYYYSSPSLPFVPGPAHWCHCGPIKIDFFVVALVTVYIHTLTHRQTNVESSMLPSASPASSSFSHCFLLCLLLFSLHSILPKGEQADSFFVQYMWMWVWEEQDQNFSFYLLGGSLRTWVMQTGVAWNRGHGAWIWKKNEQLHNNSKRNWGGSIVEQSHERDRKGGWRKWGWKAPKKGKEKKGLGGRQARSFTLIFGYLGWCWWRRWCLSMMLISWRRIIKVDCCSLPFYPFLRIFRWLHTRTTTTAGLSFSKLLTSN